MEGEVLGALTEASRDTASNLRSMVRIQADWRDMELEHHEEDLLIMRKIDKTLAELADAVSGGRGDPW